MKRGVIDCGYWNPHSTSAQPLTAKSALVSRPGQLQEGLLMETSALYGCFDPPSSSLSTLHNAH